MSSLFTVKTIFTRTNDIRRFRVSLEEDEGFESLLAFVAKTYDIQPETAVLKYLDDEDEYITLSSTSELREAVRLVQEELSLKLLKVFVSEDGFIKVDVPVEHADDEEEVKKDVPPAADVHDAPELNVVEDISPPKRTLVDNKADEDDDAWVSSSDDADADADAPVADESFPEVEELIQLIEQFIGDKDVQEAIMACLARVRRGLRDGVAADNLVLWVLADHPALQNHALTKRLLPHLSAIIEAAPKVFDIKKSLLLSYTDLVELMLTDNVNMAADLSVRQLVTSVKQALDTGAKIELDAFVTTRADDADQKASDDEKVISDVVVHKGVTCDNCGVGPIKGLRFKCVRCPNFDLCEACDAMEVHPASHIMMQIRVPMSARGFGPFRGPSRPQHTRRQLRAEFVADRTVPDNSHTLPGKSLRKTWAIKNTGERAWPAGSKLVYLSGDLKPASDEVIELPRAVPGAVVDVSVDIVTPQKAGHYVGNYRLSTPGGFRFGQRVWISLNVVEVDKPAAAPASSPSIDESFKYADGLRALAKMGFVEEEINKYLLLNNNGNVQRVVEWLLANQ